MPEPTNPIDTTAAGTEPAATTQPAGNPWEGMSEEELLSGISASDETDGDVTGSLVIEKISETGNGTVIVTYGARDRENNVAKVSRVLRGE